jgi:hypothetical protein
MRGLLAIEPLYHQIVKGNKTQTRRSGGLDVVNENPDDWEITGYTGEMGGDLIEVDFCDYMGSQRNIYLKPRYRIGEVLYLKEPYCMDNFGMAGKPYYKYDDPHPSVIKWKNKLFMPTSAARAFVKITSIKCERLLDISDEDCITEGITNMGYHGWKNYLSKSGNEYELTSKESFLSLFKFANKMKPSAVIPNLWVWAYTFEYLLEFKLGKIPSKTEM